MLSGASAAAVVLIILVVDSISVIGITFLHDPTKPFMVNKRRTIQHTPQNSMFKIVACFFDDNSVIRVLNLLELSNPPLANSSTCIYALHLIELIAQAQPSRIEHDIDDIENLEQGSNTHTSSVIRILDRFKNSIREDIEIHLFTIITAKKTMYQDICQIALDKKASLIVLPLENHQHSVIHTPLGIITTTPTTGIIDQSPTWNNTKLNKDVLHNAPCSVALFTNPSFGIYGNNLLQQSLNKSDKCYVILLFMGGADSREALSYADRIIANQNVHLTLTRFLSRDERGDDKSEKKLDDALITRFWIKHEISRRVFYNEVIVSNGEETIRAIQDLATDICKLYIVGRKHGINPMLLQGLDDWTENNELGPLGDHIASSEIARKASLIVVQQQCLRV